MHRLLIALALLISLPLLAAGEAARWEKDWAAYEAKPAPATGTIACVGSSSMRMWKSIVEDLAPLPVWNRAFGGSVTNDQVNAFPRLLLPHKPRVILYYCGDNDLSKADADPQRAVAGFSSFVALVHKELPTTRIVYLSIKPSPSRIASLPVSTRANAAIKELCAADPLLTFVDVAGPMLDAEGKPRGELFLKDRLHMNEEGYKLWTSIVKPVLGKVWEEAQADK